MYNKSITLNQYNFAGKKVEVNLNNLYNNNEIEEITIKNFNINDNFINTLNTMPNLKKLWFIGCNFSINEQIKNIETLKLEDCTNINDIDYDALTNLKILNFIECKVNDKDIFLKQFENRNIKVSFLEETPKRM